jgi:hypothetical protein
MKLKQAMLLLILVVAASSCTTINDVKLSSPGKVNEVEVGLNKLGQLVYKVNHGNEVVIKHSATGFDFKNQQPVGKGLKILTAGESAFKEEWEMPWGEQTKVINHYNELKVELSERRGEKRKFIARFRAFDDGVAFRFEFPEWEGVDSLIFMDENTDFNLSGDHTCWWIPGDWDIYEHLYTKSKFTAIDALGKKNHPDLGQTHIPENAVNTPVTMRTASGLHLCFHEANLTNYPGMTLKIDPERLSMQSELVGSDRLGHKAKVCLPFSTPWRTIQISDDAAGLIDSKMIVNLNEPNTIGDVSWFSPMKYVGVWWEMHIGKASWDYGLVQEQGTWVDKGKAHGHHGATTENAKRYIDFAAKNNISGLLVEGWNTGWEHWVGFEDREGVFDFVTPYPDYDLAEVVRYGKAKGVELIMHHETSAAPRTYSQQMDTAYALMNALGIHSVKTGYVGKIIPKGEYHHGQWMVNQYRKALVKGAKYHVAINAHEPIKATGLRRTYPNAIAREGLRGQEFNAWASDGGNPPSHLPTVVFTRMLAGPIDFTPGVFDIGLPTKPDNQINTTLAHQLALYVVIYSPIQMACDLPENYEGNPAFGFIRDVGVDWQQSKVLNGEVGEFVTIARKEKQTNNWFLGAITNEKTRKLTIDFAFLDEGINYKAVLYQDAINAHYKENPTAIELKQLEINSASTLTVELAAGGGFALSLMK